jgi:hypothetical protein
MEQRWNDTVGGGGGDRRTLRKTCPSATLSTTNPTWTDLGANPGLRGEKMATDRLSYGTASCACKLCCSLSDLPCSLLGTANHGGITNTSGVQKMPV